MHNGYKTRAGEIISHVNINNYPAIKNWFDKGDWNKKGKFKTNIQRLSERADQGVTLYNLRDCAYMDDFSRQRFAWTAVNSEYRFLVLENEIYYNNSVFHGVINKAKGIASIMNSLVMQYYFKLLSTSGYQYGGKEMMEQIPIPLTIKNNDYSEQEIGKIYHLTEEEMCLISSSVNEKTL